MYLRKMDAVGCREWFQKRKVCVRCWCTAKTGSLLEAWLFKDRTMENNHFSPSISKMCFDVYDLRMFHIKKYCGALFTLKDFIFLFWVIKICSFVLFPVCFDSIGPSKTKYASNVYIPMSDRPLCAILVKRSFRLSSKCSTNFLICRNSVSLKMYLCINFWIVFP